MNFTTKLYREYVMETNELLGINVQPAPLPLPAHASTPCINRHADSAPGIPTLDINQTENPLTEILKSQAEMKSQTASLMEIVINLQEQMQQLNSSNKEQYQVQQQNANVIEDSSNSTFEDIVNVDTTDANMYQSTVPGSMRYSEAVQIPPVAQNTAAGQGPSQTNETQENQNVQLHKKNEGPRKLAETNRTNTQTNKTLLIGDSLLSGVNRKGLKNNVHCAPFPGATIDTVYRNIAMFDLTQFKNVIIYCGGNDSAKSGNMEHFKNEYDTLLKFIKTKNPGCMLYLCNSCPRGDTDTTNVNTVIKSLAGTHGATYIDAYSAFYYNNELRTKFYKPRDWIHLSNSGIKRLLGTINLTIAIVENFKFCVFPPVSENRAETSNSHTEGKPNHRGHQREQKRRREPDTNPHNGRYHYTTQHNRDTNSSYIRQNRNDQPHPGNENGHYHYGSTTQDNYQQGYYDRNDNYEHYYDGNEKYEHYYDSNENYGQHYNKNSNQHVERCMKCGLTNHTTSDCRHKRQLLCYACNYYGHKDSICWNK